MSKASAKAAETLEYSAFDTNQAANQFRAFAEKGVEQSRETYARMKASAETTQKAMETSFESAKALSGEISLKTIAAMREGVETNFAHLEALVGVKSVSDFVELQTSYLRNVYEMSMNHARDLQSLTTRGAEDVAKPVKEMAEKAFTELKVA